MAGDPKFVIRSSHPVKNTLSGRKIRPALLGGLTRVRQWFALGPGTSIIANQVFPTSYDSFQARARVDGARVGDVTAHDADRTREQFGLSCDLKWRDTGETGEVRFAQHEVP